MKKKENGQGMVEFSLVLPLFLAMLLLIVAAGHLLWTASALHDGVKEAGRAVQVWRPDGSSTCKSVAEAAVARVATVDQVLRSPNCTDDPLIKVSSGELVTIRASLEYQPVFFSTLGNPTTPWSFPLEAEVTMRHE